ncbi:hypothetical protein Tco_0704095 [Tanacetum coccineum]|uniref:Uncharacterized protein n=1 Tax=Tanacetum coccineum TaxID=301880 RepID=A0ABQ4Y163_9ASTR
MLSQTRTRLAEHREDMWPVEIGFTDFSCSSGDTMMSSIWSAVTLLKDLCCLISGDTPSPFSVMIDRVNLLFLDKLSGVIGAIQIIVSRVFRFHGFPNVEGDSFTSDSQTQLSLMNVNYNPCCGEKGSSQNDRD